MRRIRAAALALLAGLTACTSGSGLPAGSSPTPPASTEATRTPSGSPSGSPSAAGWPTYQGGNDGAGFVDATAPRPPLRRAWTTHLDGAVYAQPIVVGSTVVVATENDSVYALA